ncbi:MAG: nucleotidyl transferase AbiEii/AbiGii toxin family protein [Candidatus Limnocylindrales bacterium]
MSRDSRLARFARLPALDPVHSILPAPQARLWPRLGDIPDPFVLYGGTALALRFGHRQSADFHFFSADGFAPAGLLDDLGWLGRLDIVDMGDNRLVVIEPGGVQLALYGGLRLQAVAEPSLVPDNGLVVASVFDLAATKAKAILDRSEWRDYVDIARLIEEGHHLADIIGYATTVFDRLFAFPAPVFLRSLVWFQDGTAPDVPDGVRRLLESAVRAVDLADIPLVEPFRETIAP